ncbi:MAG: hypothetical protein MJ157_00325 [Clostridia bacterium]|nr:hypothetical protein [Clostridia bacterium]
MKELQSWLKQIEELLNRTAAYWNYEQGERKIALPEQDELNNSFPVEVNSGLKKADLNAGEQSFGKRVLAMESQLWACLNQAKQNWSKEIWGENPSTFIQTPTADLAGNQLEPQSQQTQSPKKALAANLLINLFSTVKKEVQTGLGRNITECFREIREKPEELQAWQTILQPIAGKTEFSTQTAALKFLTNSGSNSSIVQNLQFSNVFNGEQAAQCHLAQAMQEAAGLTTGELARALAYGR